MSGDKSSKTEKPTAKRKRDAVRDGQVPRTTDLGAWLTVLTASMLAPWTAGRLRSLFDELLHAALDVGSHPEPGVATHVLHQAGVGVAVVLAPILLTSVGVAVLGGAVQGGLRVSSKRFKPKFDKLNVLKGLKHMLGAQAAWGLLKAVLKLGIFSLIAYLVLRTASAQLIASGSSLGTAVAMASGSVLHLVRMIAVAGLFVAAVDYLIERRRIGISLRMSHEEIKKEARQSDGDPHQKAAVRARQREMSGNRMMAAVATADVIVVNPTHVAVALTYEHGRGAPRVVAKGSGLMAARIREEAERHHRPMVQDIPLARTLYKACELGDEIPIEMYDAVARVLAFVMALSRRGASSGPIRVPALAGGVLASSSGAAGR